jgi:ABC-2 type transport system permease protein
MTAGLAIQRTVERSDSVPIGEWAGLGVAAACAAAGLILGLLLVRRRDA